MTRLACCPRIAIGRGRAWMLPALLALGLALPAAARAPDAVDTGVVGVGTAQLSAGYWIARQPHPDRVILDPAGIEAQNARMRATDPAIRDLRALPAQVPRARVLAEIGALSTLPGRALFDGQGNRLDASALQALTDALALDAVPDTRPLRYGLVTARADLRTFPTARPVFTAPGDRDIDRFQESALFPGDAVAVLHASRDGAWWFVVSERYAAWIRQDQVAVGEADDVFGHAQRTPFLVVTGAAVRTTTTPEQPQVSDLPLDMGVRLPLLADWPADAPVNGQHPHASHVVQLPIRGDDGRLQLVPALLPRTADVSPGYLPLTPRNLIEQGFKFLGERYGWGHRYGARDCSGFVSEVYRSFGVLMPRNTGQQAVSPALDRLAFTPGGAPATRAAAAQALEVGDLVYIPGHVLMAIGHDRGMAYMIHDIAGGSWRGADGERVQARLNGVSVTPLQPMLLGDGTVYVDRMTSIQRIRPLPAP